MFAIVDQRDVIHGVTASLDAAKDAAAGLLAIQAEDESLASPFMCLRIEKVINLDEPIPAIPSVTANIGSAEYVP